MSYWTHKRVSYLKSGLRIMACGCAILMPTVQQGVSVLAWGLATAEILGVLEELGARGE